MQELSAEECQTSKEALKSLMGKVYQPIVIKELLILQGGPKQVNIILCTAGIRSFFFSSIPSILFPQNWPDFPLPVAHILSLPVWIRSKQ